MYRSTATAPIVHLSDPDLEDRVNDLLNSMNLTDVTLDDEMVHAFVFKLMCEARTCEMFIYQESFGAFGMAVVSEGQTQYFGTFDQLRRVLT